MTRKPLILLAAAALLLAACKEEQSAPVETNSGSKAPISAKERPNLEPRAIGTPSKPEQAGIKAPKRVETPPPTELPAKEPELEEVSSSKFEDVTVDVVLTPNELDVMRDTKVVLEARFPPDSPAGLSCVWDPGDRSGEIEGCKATHVFQGGLTDRTVTLRLLASGTRVLDKSAPLPLERLPVQPLEDQPTLTLPAPPLAEEEGIRVAFAGLFDCSDEGQLSTLEAALAQTAPKVVFLFLDCAISSETARELLQRMNQGHDWTAFPIYAEPLKLGAKDAPQVSSADFIEHGEDNDLPFRGSLLGHGTLFLLLDPRLQGIHREQEKWLLEELEKSKVASHRVVLSAMPLEGYGNREAPELVPQFRYYEKLLRGDPSLFVSSEHPVFLHAQYGQLPTLSIGAATGEPGRLPGSEATQPRLFVVMDLTPKERPRVYPMEMSPELKVWSGGDSPWKVGSYRRISR